MKILILLELKQLLNYLLIDVLSKIVPHFDLKIAKPELRFAY